MSLQYILGNAGSGKTEYLYQQTIQNAIDYPEQQFLVLVPNQFTMQTQREFIQRHPRHCLMNIEVLSFERLAYRVFEEMGIQQLTVLEDTGKKLILRKIIEENKSKLNILNHRVEKPGFIDEIKSLLTEFTQYRITPEILRSLLDDSQPGVLEMKLRDLLLIYEEFQKFCGTSYITSEDIMTLLASKIEDSKLIQNSTIIFDGYTGFTPVQNELVAKLLKVANKISIAIVLDEKSDFMMKPQIQDLWYMSHKFIQSLNQIAQKEKVLIEDPIIIPHSTKDRFQNSSELAFLEKNIFRNKQAVYHQKMERIRICRLQSPEEEIRKAGEVIIDKIRKEGYQYADFAVVTASVEEHVNYIDHAFGDLRIPFYVDRKDPVTFNVLFEALHGFLQIVEENYSYEGVFRFLKSGLTNLTQEEISTLENDCLARRAKGAKSWHQGNWGGEAKRIVLEMIDEPVKQLKEAVSVRDKTEVLYRLLIQLDAESKMKGIAERLNEENNTQLAKAYEQIFPNVIDLFDKYVSILGETPLSINEYREILDTGMESVKIGTIPWQNDYVLIGDIERTRLDHIKYLILVGVNDGLIPRITTGSLCLSQAEREHLKEENIELAPSSRERAFIQQFYLYLSMTKPSEYLYLSYAERDGEGAALNPSYLIRKIQKLYPGLEIEIQEDNRITLENLYTPEQSVSYLLEGFTKEDKKPEFYQLLSWFLKDQDWTELAQELLKANHYCYQDEKLTPEISQKLYDKMIGVSISRLERFQSCPYSHFLNYGIRIKERDEGEVDASETGSILHESMQHFGERMRQEGQEWDQLSDERRDLFIDDAVAMTISEEAVPYLFENARTIYQIQRLKKILKRAVSTTCRQVKDSGYTPYEYEKTFSEQGVKGKIDRIDIRTEEQDLFFRVIDYKSGNKKLNLNEIYDGRQLQLLVYTYETAKVLSKECPQFRIHDGGAFYFHLEDPMISIKNTAEEMLVEEKIYEALRLNGISVEQGNELDKVSQGEEKVFIDELKDYVMDKTEFITSEMRQGKITALPFREGTKTGCDYCPYLQICRFDANIKGFSYRNCSKFNKEEFLENRGIVKK